MLNGPFRVTPNQPVDQEIADVMSAMMNHEFEMAILAEIDDLLYGGTHLGVMRCIDG